MQMNSLDQDKWIMKASRGVLLWAYAILVIMVFLSGCHAVSTQSQEASPSDVKAASDAVRPLTRVTRVTPIIFATMDSKARTLSAQKMALSGTSGPSAAQAHSATITLSTYIFVLLTVLACMVGAVFSFICCKLMSSERSKY